MQEGAWPRSAAPPGSCPVGGGALHSRPLLGGPSQQLAMQGRAGWGAVSEGESLKTLVLAISLSRSPDCLPGVPAPRQGLG